MGKKGLVLEKKMALNDRKNQAKTMTLDPVGG